MRFARRLIQREAKPILHFLRHRSPACGGGLFERVPRIRSGPGGERVGLAGIVAPRLAAGTWSSLAGALGCHRYPYYLSSHNNASGITVDAIEAWTGYIWQYPM